jgi:hypothetical protein
MKKGDCSQPQLATPSWPPQGRTPFYWLKIGKIWKKFDQTKRMQPSGIFFNHPFKSYSSFKMTCLKRNVKTAAFFFVTAGCHF